MSFFLSQSGHSLTHGAIQQMMRDLGQAAGVPRMHPHLCVTLLPPSTW